ncbi:MAG TPA: hypothetical protein VHT74_08450 [Acetobacteraceae bacterium]|nr:hypothetical protein [Acetobacteraceae bacterium]
MLLLELACARPLHQRDELVAKADEGVALAPAAQGEPEDLAVERQCRIGARRQQVVTRRGIFADRRRRSARRAKPHPASGFGHQHRHAARRGDMR